MSSPLADSTAASASTAAPRTASRGTLPPGPPWPAAYTLARWVRHPTRVLDECARAYGDTFTLRLPGYDPFVVFTRPADVKEIFTGNPDELFAGEGNQIIESLVGKNSLLLLDGPAHLRERKMMMPSFHGERMRAYGAIIQDTARRVIDRWTPGQPFGIHPEAQEITLEVILRTVFGVDEGPRLSRLRDALTTMLVGATNPLLFLLSVILPADRLRQLLYLGADRWSPSFAPWLDLSRAVPWRGLSLVSREVEETLYAEIARARSADLTKREDVLSMLVAARDESGNPMTDIQLRDEMITLLVAGHETTATTLSWVMHHTLDRPDVMAKIMAEIDRVGAGEPLKPEQCASLEYLDATIREAMRLTPIVINVARRLQRPLRIGGWDLPKGTIAIPGIYLTHRRADVWGDPEAFRPERFLERKFDPYEYFPFGGGTRRCIGMAFAQYEMRIILAEMFQRVSLRKADGIRVKAVRRGITMAPSDDLKLVVEARRDFLPAASPGSLPSTHPTTPSRGARQERGTS